MSNDYWEQRYKKGGGSGYGSKGKLAQFKADVVNNFVQENNIQTIIEYGCGDGNQLSLAKYPSYIGFDISERAIELCKFKFKGDRNKVFKSVYTNETAELTLSLDVIYHLVKGNDDYVTYMHRLFDSSLRFVVIYSSNTDKQAKKQAAHVKHHKFTDWVEHNKPEWELIEQIPNKHPYTGDSKTGSISDFYIYRRISWNVRKLYKIC